MILVFIMNKTILNNYGIFMMIYIIMTAFECLANKYSSKQGENKCLYKSHQQFYEINKYGKPYSQWRSSPASICTKLAENKYQGDQADNNDMPCYHVCKKTDDQCKRLYEYAQEFNRNKD
jgi:uncharacterized protein with ATP-grasp and redox domains